MKNMGNGNWKMGCNPLAPWCIDRSLYESGLFAASMYHVMGKMLKMMSITFQYNAQALMILNYDASIDPSMNEAFSQHQCIMWHGKNVQEFEYHTSIQCSNFDDTQLGCIYRSFCWRILVGGLFATSMCHDIGKGKCNIYISSRTLTLFLHTLRVWTGIILLSTLF